MKKYMAPLLVISFFISNVSIASASSYNLISTSFRSLLTQKALKVNMTIKQRYPSSGSMSSYNLMYPSSNQSTTFSVDATQDISTPGMVKAAQSVSITGPMLSMFGLSSKISLEDRIIGDTIYIKVPGILINTIIGRGEINATNFPDTWVQITQNDINNLASGDMSFISGFYSYLTAFNSQPMQYISDQQDLWLQFTQSFKVNKTGSKFVNGKKVNVFHVTFDKALYKKALTASRREQYADGKLPAYETKNINSEAESIKVKNMSFSIIADNTNLPSALSGSVYMYNSYDKKLSSITDIDLKFSDFGVPFTPEVPVGFVTATTFYNQYIKPIYVEAHVKGAEAAIKAMASSMRAQAELIYSDANSYGTTANVGSCANPTVGSLFNSSSQYGDQFKSYISGIVSQGGTNTECYSSGISWAFSVTLPSGKNYCVDSTGVSKETTSSATGNSCPQY